MFKSARLAFLASSKQSAFTLIELLVTVSIISILSSISVATYEEYRAHAYNTAALSDLSMIRTAQEMYHLDNDQYANCTKASVCLPLFDSITTFSDTVGVFITSADINVNYTAFTCSERGSIVSTGSTVNRKYFVYNSEVGVPVTSQIDTGGCQTIGG